MLCRAAASPITVRVQLALPHWETVPCRSSGGDRRCSDRSPDRLSAECPQHCACQGGDIRGPARHECQRDAADCRCRLSTWGGSRGLCTARLHRIGRRTGSKDDHPTRRLRSGTTRRGASPRARRRGLASDRSAAPLPWCVVCGPRLPGARCRFRAGAGEVIFGPVHDDLRAVTVVP